MSPSSTPKSRLVPGYEFTEDGPRLRTDAEAKRHRQATASSPDPWVHEYLKAKAKREEEDDGLHA
jgi:hypothetical protein